MSIMIAIKNMDNGSHDKTQRFVIQYQTELVKEYNKYIKSRGTPGEIEILKPFYNRWNSPLKIYNNTDFKTDRIVIIKGKPIYDKVQESKRNTDNWNSRDQTINEQFFNELKISDKYDLLNEYYSFDNDTNNDNNLVNTIDSSYMYNNIDSKEYNRTKTHTLYLPAGVFKFHDLVESIKKSNYLSGDNIYKPIFHDDNMIKLKIKNIKEIEIEEGFKSEIYYEKNRYFNFRKGCI